MSKLLRLLTATVLTVHLMMGCCLHHAHACESMNGALPEWASSSHGIHCDHLPGSDSDHSGPHKCQGEKCSFIPLNLNTCQPPTQPLEGFVLPLIGHVVSLKGILAEQHFSTAGRLPPPLRLHLTKQVLLI
jgi:hypothetical protein